ncbi:calphotin-like [Pectinophora gossypiella]|uniref:calphotin-like n=1 Tax=Pectinophora gossypiella TaxID=13191 RepID=UPI00214E27D5|nr:calphotin-like [Pectinophora gossypiella]
MFSFKSIALIAAAFAIGAECSEVAVPAVAAAPLTVPAHVGYSHAVPQNIPPFAAQYSVVNRAIAAPYAAPLAAPFAAPLAAPVAAPLAAPVAAPLAAPVAAPLAAPIAARYAAPFAAAPYYAGPGAVVPAAAPYAVPGPAFAAPAAYAAAPYAYGATPFLRTPFGVAPAFVR